MADDEDGEKPVVIFGIVQVQPTSKVKRDRELHNSEVRSHAMKVRPTLADEVTTAD
jgi:hypothetical protein